MPSPIHPNFQAKHQNIPHKKGLKFSTELQILALNLEAASDTGNHHFFFQVCRYQAPRPPMLIPVASHVIFENEFKTQQKWKLQIQDAKISNDSFEQILLDIIDFGYPRPFGSSQYHSSAPATSASWGAPLPCCLHNPRSTRSSCRGEQSTPTENPCLERGGVLSIEFVI